MLLMLTAAGFTACGRNGGGTGSSSPPAGETLRLPWAEIEQRARGQTVNMTMWQGDPYINAYMRDWVAPRLLKNFGVTLDIAGGQGDTLVSALTAEREAGRNTGSIDLVWINGETFYQLRQIGALLGPFTNVLPNDHYVRWDDPFVNRDFQKAVDGYESPWGNVQLALIYDTNRVTDPPKNTAALEAWVRAHPGRFTLDTSFTGLTFLKCLLYEFAGGAEALAGPFDEAKYNRHAAQLWAYLNRIKPFLWKNGRTYPEGVAQLHQLFASGEVDFTMSNNDGEVDNKVTLGTFPATARAYVLDAGTIRNSHYLGIPVGAPHLPAALVACNFLLSPEAQCEKLKATVWADGTVLDTARLPAEWQERFREAGHRAHGPTHDEIASRALPEPAPEYMIRLYKDFRSHVIEQH